jgi:hypothetical protein
LHFVELKGTYQWTLSGAKRGEALQTQRDIANPELAGEPLETGAFSRRMRES